MPFFANVQSKRRKEDGVRVDIVASGFGDPFDKDGPIATRAKVRAAIASNVVPDFVAHDLDSILEYGTRPVIIDIKEHSPGEDMKDSLRDEFGPIYNSANTALYRILVTDRFSVADR